MSLLHRLLLLVLLAMVPAVGLEIDNELDLRHDRELDLRQSALSLAGFIDAEQARMLEGIGQTLTTVAQTKSARSGMTDECLPLMERLRPAYPDHLTIQVIDSQGHLFCSTRTEDVGRSLGDQSDYRSALAAVGAVVVGEFRREPDGRAVLPLSLAFPAGEGTGGGVVTALIDLRSMARYLAEKPLPNDAMVTIVDHNGTILAQAPARPGEPDRVGTPLPDRLQPLIRSATPDTLETSGFDGRSRIVAASPLGAGQPEMAVAVALDRVAALGFLDRAMMRELATVAVLALLTLLAVWWVGNRFLRQPVDALIETARRWRAGDLSARTGLAHDRSEVGVLGRAFDAMAEDLQRRTLEREQAHALAHKMAAVLSSTTDGVFEVDPDWRVTFMNERACSMVAGNQEVAGLSLWDVYPEAAESVFGESYRRAMTEQVPVEFEGYYPPLESWYAVRAFPSRDGLAVFLQDITARKWGEHALAEAESARRQSDERFRSIFELAAVGIERVSLEGRYLDVNVKLCGILGVRREDLLGGSIRDRADPADQTAEDALIDRLQAGDIPSYAIEKRYRRADGSLVWTLVTSSLARTADNEEAYRIAIVEDITERKAMEEALRSAKDEAERANLAKSRFLAAASHDLRQPLQSLFFFTAALDGHLSAAHGGNFSGVDPRAAGMVRHLQEGLDVLKELLDSLLDVSRLDAGVVTPALEDFPLSELLEHIDTAYASAAAIKGLEWRVESCGGNVHSDRTLLLRLVRNLVENAVRYTESGLVRVQCRTEGDRVAILVQDTGIGIPPEHMERIFEEFHQVGNPERDRTQGLGLGLAIVRRLSRLLDHPVEVRSVQGRGSAFRVLVPAARAQERPAERKAPSLTEPLTEGRGRLAVLVDDDAVVLMGLQIILKEWGYSVLAAGDADQAMERLDNQKHPPDIVIADYRLREGRVGTEVVRRVRERFGAEVPGVILTGETGPECLHDAAAHNVRVIHKPVTPRQLSTAVERQLKAG